MIGLSYQKMARQNSTKRAVDRGFIAPLRAVVLLLSLLGSLSAHGLTVVPRSFDELVLLSDLILAGTVREIHSHYADGGLNRNTIVSDVTLSDLQMVKGELDTADYVLRVPGGVVGRYAQDYPGIPAFQTGQRYLVFIRGNRRDFFPVVGVGQGVFRILINGQGEPVVIRDDHVNHAGVRALSALTQTAPTLDEFIRQIKARMPLEQSQ